MRDPDGGNKRLQNVGACTPLHLASSSRNWNFYSGRIRVGPVTFVDLGSRTRLAVAADHGAAQKGCRCFVFPSSSSV